MYAGKLSSIVAEVEIVMLYMTEYAVCIKLYSQQSKIVKFIHFWITLACTF